MDASELRLRRWALQRENRKWPARMREVPMVDWSDDMKALAVCLHTDVVPLRVWRSRRLSAVLYDEGPRKPNRLTVHRAAFADDGRFVAGITWDELMQVKRECGFDKVDALELYPSDRTNVDVENMRHLWILQVSSRLNWNR